MRRRPSIEAADLPRIGSPAATTEDRAIQVPCDSLGRCARIARAAPARADTAQNALTLHADLAIPTAPPDDAGREAARGEVGQQSCPPTTMRAAKGPEDKSGNEAAARGATSATQ